MTDYQIFISYRRSGGIEFASHLHERLDGIGYKSFFDCESMRSGDFDKQIYDTIDTCEDFVLVLPENALDRCVEENDWVCLEIIHAVKNGKNIVPIYLPNFVFPDNLQLPDEVIRIKNKQAVFHDPKNFDNTIRQLEKYLYSRVEKRKVLDNLETGIKYINMGLYEKALDNFLNKADDDASGLSYYYAAISLLSGKMPFLCSRSVVDTAINYLNAAICCEEKAVYRYFLSYIKFDFYYKKKYRISPDFGAEFYIAKKLGITNKDAVALFDMLSCEMPVELEV